MNIGIDIDESLAFIDLEFILKVLEIIKSE